MDFKCCIFEYYVPLGTLAQQSLMTISLKIFKDLHLTKLWDSPQNNYIFQEWNSVSQDTNGRHFYNQLYFWTIVLLGSLNMSVSFSSEIN